MSTRVVRRSLLLALGLLSCVGRPAKAQDAPAWTFEFHHDFRGRPLPRELDWFNAEGGKYFHEEPEGFRIGIPATWIHPWGGIGLRTNFGFSGDFEVTTAFEILQADTPPQGYGVGVCLYLSRTGGGGASVCRLTRKAGREILLWDHHSPIVPDKVFEGEVPAVEKAGRLRFERAGTVLRYLWAPGLEGGQFQQIKQVEFGDMPIDRVRLAGLTGRQPCNLDLRLLDLHIRSRSTDQPPVAEAPPAARPSWRLGLVSAVLLAIAVGTWLAVRRSRREARG